MANPSFSSGEMPAKMAARSQRTRRRMTDGALARLRRAEKRGDAASSVVSAVWLNLPASGTKCVSEVERPQEGKGLRSLRRGDKTILRRSTSHDRHVVLRFGSDAAGNNGDEQSSNESEGTSSFPVPFYPAVAHWSCTVPPGAWSTPWLSPVASSSAESSSPTIRKRSRMDDPEVAARRSAVKAFQRKVDDKDHGMEAPLLLHADPAALSRSLSFQESSQRSAAVGEIRSVSLLM
ncbi:hypothetical protein BHE74_00031069 [Ensete ventricosum]|nr:hypothetical protein GW17_00046214 [Ensete ventricosum]RWW61843.1 hypothetical protein BHE74_00031069 [Ensete ventricosum]RZS02585.1 hypothetical protein BHM03_00032684 [Ensete ventricosum]